MRFPSMLAVLVAGVVPALSAELPDYIRPPHREAIHAWLDRHPDYRLATPQDCQCNDDIDSLRRGAGGPWKPEPSYQPYAAVGDFDGDGIQDLAVVVLPLHSDGKIIVLVSFGKKAGVAGEMLEIPRDGSSVVDRGLFARTPDPKSRQRRWRLLFGAFESEAEELPIRRRK